MRPDPARRASASRSTCATKPPAHPSRASPADRARPGHQGARRSFVASRSGSRARSRTLARPRAGIYFGLKARRPPSTSSSTAQRYATDEAYACGRARGQGASSGHPRSLRLIADRIRSRRTRGPAGNAGATEADSPRRACWPGRGAGATGPGIRAGVDELDESGHHDVSRGLPARRARILLSPMVRARRGEVHLRVRSRAAAARGEVDVIVLGRGGVSEGRRRSARRSSRPGQVRRAACRGGRGRARRGRGARRLRRGRRAQRAPSQAPPRWVVRIRRRARASYGARLHPPRPGDAWAADRGPRCRRAHGERGIRASPSRRTPAVARRTRRAADGVDLLGRRRRRDALGRAKHRLAYLRRERSWRRACRLAGWRDRLAGVWKRAEAEAPATSPMRRDGFRRLQPGVAPRGYCRDPRRRSRRAVGG